MKRLFSVLILIVFALISPASLVAKSSPAPSQAPSPSPTPKSEKVDAFSLFWPLVAGKVRGEQFYSLKLLKEKFRSTLIFSTYRKTDYFITISTKRTLEEVKLLKEKKDKDNALKTQKDAQSSREQVIKQLEKVKAEGRSTQDLVTTFEIVLKNQKALLEDTALDLDEQFKSIIENDISNIDSTISQLK